MRIVKPRSANNSPQSSVMSNRNRVAASQDDSIFTNPHQVPQQPLPSPNYFAVNHGTGSVEAGVFRPERPVSWHPSSTYLMPTQYPAQHTHPSLAGNVQMPAQWSAYATPALTTDDYEPFPSLQPFTLSPYAYSNQTSPSTAFSPYSGSHDYMTAGHYYSPNPWAMSPSINTTGAMFGKLPSPVELPASIACQQPQQTLNGQAPSYLDLQPPTQAYSQPGMESSSDCNWNTTSAHGFIAPRTPPDSNYFSAVEQAHARIPSQSSILSCPEQDDDQQEGEILVGMGLYDPPEKEVIDPILQNYRSSVAQLLGAAYTFPEPVGKGLKLEDAWEPPENLDDEDSDNDEDRDAEGEDQQAIFDTLST